MTIDFSQDLPLGQEIEPDVVPMQGSEIVSVYQLAGSLSEFVSCEFDMADTLEDCELKPGLQVDRVTENLLRQMISTRSAIASFFVHALMICLVIVAAAGHSQGTYGQGGEQIMVRFVAEQECVPVEETACIGRFSRIIPFGGRQT